MAQTKRSVVAKKRVVKASAAPVKRRVAKAPEAPAVAVLKVASHFDDVSPDAPVEVLAAYCERLAVLVRTHLAALSKAKVNAEMADQLERGAEALRTAEDGWQKAQSGGKVSALMALRASLREGRGDLVSALATFCGDDREVARALRKIADVRSDDDLVDDVRSLLVLVSAQAETLAGTDVDGARVAEVSEALRAFKAARASRKKHTAVALNKGEVEAIRARNRAFWALAELARVVSARGRHAFRKDPRQAGEFVAYTLRSNRKRKKVD